MGHLLVMAQLEGGRVKSATSRAVTAARIVARELCGFSILAVGRVSSQALEELSHLGAERVFVARDDRLEFGPAEAWTPIVVEAMRLCGARMLISPANATSRDVLPRVACRLNAGMASEVTDIEWSDGGTVFQRPMYAGNVSASVRIETDIAVVTVRTAGFTPALFCDTPCPVVVMEPSQPDAAAAQIEILEMNATSTDRPDPTEAPVVCAGGRGLQSKERFALIEALADVFGGAVAGTRAAVDAGYISSELQVGQTGKIVAPELYVACGISGAVQHVAGMKSARVVVAINKDPGAPIFEHADYGIVDDLFKVLPEFIEELKKRHQEA